jgi:hypothetical protein
MVAVEGAEMKLFGSLDNFASTSRRGQ